jgi:hypothetical protein
MTTDGVDDAYFPVTNVLIVQAIPHLDNTTVRRIYVHSILGFCRRTSLIRASLSCTEGGIGSL